MPSQKTFKRRVRARAEKTGESYTTARAHLIRRADAGAALPAGDPTELPTSDDAVLRGTGHAWAHWFGVLDAWGAKERRHPEIARWLREEHAVDGWWAQSITVGYERARGMRGKHEIGSGFAVSVSRTVSVPVDLLRAAVADAAPRRRWLPDVALRRRPTRAVTSARFDWPEPPSIVVAHFAARGDAKSTLTVAHERLPDEAAADRFKAYWRERLSALKELLERS